VFRTSALTLPTDFDLASAANPANFVGIIKCEMCAHLEKADKPNCLECGYPTVGGKTNDVIVKKELPVPLWKITETVECCWCFTKCELYPMTPEVNFCTGCGYTLGNQCAHCFTKPIIEVGDACARCNGCVWNYSAIGSEY
jgi:hypothetical protein